MMTTKTETIHTTCSGCMASVTIRLDANHAGTAMVNADTSDVFYDGGLGEETFSLIMWDCPACEYADSYDRNYYA